MKDDLYNALREPSLLTSPAPWAGHIPFAFWLIPKIRPKLFVELGAYSGISYFAFCEAALSSQTSVSCFAIDTWHGDEHAGIYDDNVYNKFLVDNLRYEQFSTAIRSKFDEAISAFEDKSIDLLHIDGLHTYEAVKHDFETWKPKLTEDAVVLFHDTEVIHSDFGVHKFWSELKSKYATIEFSHSNGLGVLFVNPQKLADLKLHVIGELPIIEVRDLFRALGERFELRAKTIHNDRLLADSSASLELLQNSVKQQGDWINKLDTDILDKDRQIATLQESAYSLNTQNSELRQISHTSSLEIHSLLISIESLKEEISKRIMPLEKSHQQNKSEIDEYKRIILEKDLTISSHSADIESLHKELDGIYSSKSWKLTQPLRFLNSIKSKALGSTVFRKARTAITMLANGRFSDLLARTQLLLAPHPKRFDPSDFKDKTHVDVGILYTPHTFFVAKTLQKALAKIGLSCDLLGGNNASTGNHQLYFVICPQMHGNLPPSDRMICFQMEQSVSDRWFTAEYIDLLENSLAVADYSQSNLRYLDSRGIVYPHTFYVPVGTYSGYRDTSNLDPHILSAKKPEWDVFFYGDTSSPRRQSALKVLKDNFSVRIEKDLFGDALYNAMLTCSVVVNIHFYEDALLETTRVCECLSMGMPVVSESSIDISEHGTLASLISLFPVGDMDAMVHSVRHALLNRTESIQSAKYSTELEHRFQFSLYRMLLALNVITFDKLYSNTNSLPRSDSYALSLPETFLRRKSFLNISPPDVLIFDGIRRYPGWSGCALSYKFLAKQALDAGQTHLLVMEDDVRFPDSFKFHQKSVQDFLLRNNKGWDIFSGLMAKVHPETKVLDAWICPETGLIFVTIDRMMSMVYNMYSSRSLELLSKWDENNLDPHTNTIDQYLQNFPLRVVTTIPFLVGHDESANSSLWGISNAAYNSLISTAESTLRALAINFIDSRNPH